MILGTDNPAGDRATLDDLFRRAGVRRPEALALADPPNSESVTGGAPRQLTFAEADRAISAFAAKLGRLGLQTDTVVALQLPNTVESVIALLGLLRAGMIAVPVPLLWRQREIVEALGRVGAKALITSARVGAVAQAEIAMQVAAELFPIRHVCAFGEALPDGVVPLDDIFAPAPADVMAPAGRPSDPAARIAVVTLEVGVSGLIPVARNHRQVIAGGLGVFRESGIAPDTAILSTVPLASFAGFALALVPWLMSGGTLHLHHGFAPDTFTAQCRALEGGAVMLPGLALEPIAAADKLADANTVIALWRAPERLATAAPWRGDAALTDVASFGEIGVLAARRGAEGMPAPLSLGQSANPHAAPDAVTVADVIRTKAATLALRGPMVPEHAFPPGAERSHEPYLSPDDAGFLDTGFTCSLGNDGHTITVTGAPGGLATIGGYRFCPHAMDELVAAVDPAASVVPLPDALLGQRLAGSARDRWLTYAGLQMSGVNPLISGAFGPRRGSNAA